jgi:hypothetical protein
MVNGLSVFLLIGTHNSGLDDLICLTPFSVFVSWRILFSSKTLRQIGEEDPAAQKRIDG